MNELLLRLPRVAGPGLQDEAAGAPQAQELSEHERVALPKQGADQRRPALWGLFRGLVSRPRRLH